MEERNRRRNGGRQGNVVGEHAVWALRGIVGTICGSITMAFFWACLEAIEKVRSEQDASNLSILEVLVLTTSVLLQSTYNCLVLISFFVLVVTGFTVIVQEVIFGRLFEDELHECRKMLLNFIMFKLIMMRFILSDDLHEYMVWVACFALIGSSKWLMTLCSIRYHQISARPEIDRTDFMIYGLFTVLVGSVNALWALFMYHLCLDEVGWTPMLLLFGDCLVIPIECVEVTVIYATHIYRMDHEAEPRINVWSQNAIYVTGFLCELTIHTITILLYMHVWYANGMTVYQMIDVFLLFNSLNHIQQIRKRVTDHKNYMSVKSQINRFKDTSEEDLNDSPMCVICRDNMDIGFAKTLPCGHSYDLQCLEAYLRYNQICPICRYDLVNNRPARTDAPLLNQPPIIPPPNQGVPNQIAFQGVSSIFRFDSSAWSDWLPNISFEVLRQQGPLAGLAVNGGIVPGAPVQQDVDALNESIQRVLAVFPQADIVRVRADLTITNNVEETINNIINETLAPAPPLLPT